MKAILYLTVKGPVGWEDLYKEITLPFTPYPGLVLTIFRRLGALSLYRTKGV